MQPKFAKPAECAHCSLNGGIAHSLGYAPAIGPHNSPLLFVGEALGEIEVYRGEPFSGDAGGMLGLMFRRSSIDRSAVRIDNCIRCQPPGNWLEGAPWEHSALNHCSQYLSSTISEANYAHKVIVPLGGVALRRVLGLGDVAGVRVQDFHGTVHLLPSGQFVVPTYHPSHLQRGAINLLDVVRFDLDLAQRVAREGWTPRPVSKVLDPPVAWFDAWTTQYLRAASQDPQGVWLATDVETPDKSGGRDEGELTPDDHSTTILRVNFSCHPDEGVTVPYQGPYITLIERLLAAPYLKVLWNKNYDRRRLRLAGHSEGGQWLDFMWAWHRLQSDLPRGLGFVAPLASDYGAWKHLGRIPGKEAEYAAVDGFQTLRCAFYIAKHLVEQRMWDVFMRHTHLLEEIVLRPAYDIGMTTDVPALDAFHQHLDTVCGEKLTDIKGLETAGTLKPKQGYKTKPKGEPPKSLLGKKKGEKTSKDDYLASGIKLVERQVSETVLLCRVCNKEDVPKKHACRKFSLWDEERPPLVPITRPGSRWYWQVPFNPDSSQQILRYITDAGEAPGKAKKTRKPTTNAETLRRLARTTGDPIYQLLLDYKAVKKVDSTYALGVKRRIWSDGRIHPEYTFKPSTGRLSYQNPNITNVIADKGGRDSLAAGFRRCLSAAPGCRLLEVDYSGSEAVDTGWYLRDPNYIRLARLGVHAFLASHLLNRPASLAWSDSDLAAYFADIKKKEPAIYDKSKRCVHGNNYGLTIYGMVQNFPDVFHNLKEAQAVQDMYYSVVPGLQTWHASVRAQAKRQGYLGGYGAHPFGYKHYFFGVDSLKSLSQGEYLKLKAKNSPNLVIVDGRPYRQQMGEDSKRVVAFFPQSTTAGKLFESMLRCFLPDSACYIGDAYYGKTPLRAPIHDSLLFEVPNEQLDRVAARVGTAMQMPMLQLPCPAEWGIGPYLKTGVEMKVSAVGGNWMEMEKIPVPYLEDMTVNLSVAASLANEQMYTPDEDDELEDLFDLETTTRREELSL